MSDELHIRRLRSALRNAIECSLAACPHVSLALWNERQGDDGSQVVSVMAIPDESWIPAARVNVRLGGKERAPRVVEVYVDQASSGPQAISLEAALTTHECYAKIDSLLRDPEVKAALVAQHTETFELQMLPEVAALRAKTVDALIESTKPSKGRSV